MWIMCVVAWPVHMETLGGDARAIYTVLLGFVSRRAPHVSAWDSQMVRGILQLHVPRGK